MRVEYGSATALRAAMEGIRSIDPSEKGRTYTRAVAEETLELKLTPPTRLVNQAEELRVGTLTLSLLPTPGIHAPTCMLVYVPELGLLVAPKEVGLDRPPKPESGADPGRVVATLERVKGSGAPLRWALLGHFDPIGKPDLEATLRAWRRLETNG
jgi:glyoxylase-like metal-dependent hydrolase (beta-lactamase superfamily II)